MAEVNKFTTIFLCENKPTSQVPTEHHRHFFLFSPYKIDFLPSITFFYYTLRIHTQTDSIKVRPVLSPSFLKKKKKITVYFSYFYFNIYLPRSQRQVLAHPLPTSRARRASSAYLSSLFSNKSTHIQTFKIGTSTLSLSISHSLSLLYTKITGKQHKNRPPVGLRQKIKKNQKNIISISSSSNSRFISHFIQ